MRAYRFAVAGALLALALPLAAQAQRDSVRRDANPPAARQGRGMRGQRGADRAQLQRRIRQAFTRLVRTQVGLSDDQMHQLAPINQKFVRERRQVAQQERELREQLRAELAKPSPDQAKVAEYSDKLQQFPRTFRALGSTSTTRRTRSWPGS
jgi:Spy/CpxP family protein refolding chaperone